MESKDGPMGCARILYMINFKFAKKLQDKKIYEFRKDMSYNL